MNHPVWFMCEFRTKVPATLAAVDEVAADVRRKTAMAVDASHSFAAELLAREALNNAVLHGCRLDPDRQIHCTLRLRRHSMTIAVRDSGEGFNWRSAWLHTADSTATSGRGMEVLRRYATRVRFNDEGNSVMIVRRYSQEGTK